MKAHRPRIAHGPGIAGRRGLSSKKAIKRRAGAALTWSLGVILGGPQLAEAVASYQVDATAGASYNSNVFEIPRSQPLPPNVHFRGDIIQDYTLAGDLNFGDPVLTFDLSAKGTHYTYERIGQLTHNEENAAAKLHWHPGEVFDLQLQYAYDRALAPFAQTLTTRLSIDTNKFATATLSVFITPLWRLDLEPQDHEAQTPLLGLQVGQAADGTLQTASFPDFSLHETGGTVTLNYLGVSHITAGVAANYTHGTFSHITGATTYDQYTGELVVKYNISELSNLSATLGYTERNSVSNGADNTPCVLDNSTPPGMMCPTTTMANANLGSFTGGVGKTTGVTGNITYSRTLSPKTKVDATAFRLISSYVGGANSLLATGVNAAVHWKPDVKFEINVTGQFEQDDFGGAGQVLAVGQNNAPVADRTDRLFTTTAQVRYLALSWLNATGHFDYAVRTSNLSLAGYSGYDVGLDLTATLKP